MHLLPLLTLAALAATPVPDAGSFSDSELGRKRAGEDVRPLAEQWVEGLAEAPLFLRVERHSDDLAVAFYAREPSRPDAGAPIFSERARFAVPQTRILDGLEVRELGPAGEVLALTTHADDPDEEPVALTLIGRGPKVLLQTSFLRDPPPGEPLLELGGGEGFALVVDGGKAEVDVGSQTKRVPVVRPDGGPGEVELGRRQKVFRFKGDGFAPAGEGYRDFLMPLKLAAPGHGKLVDGKPKTFERLRSGQSVKVELPPGASLRIVRVVPGCLDSEAHAAKEPGARELSLQLDDAAPISISVGKPVSDARLFGAGEFTLGEGYGTSELLVFAQPVAAKTLTVTASGQGGCLAEIAAY